MEKLVRYDLNDKIATLTMDDGKANVLSIRMLGELNAALDQAEKAQATVVITGREGMFSGGFDLATFKRDPLEVLQMLEAGARLTERLLSFPFPVVGASSGHAVAMGVFLLLSTDFRIGMEGDFRFQVNEVKIGLPVPRFAIEVCRQRLTPAHLNLAVSTAEPYLPSQARSAGFVDEIAAPASFSERAQVRAAALSKLDQRAFTSTKLRLHEKILAGLREAIAADVAEWKSGFLNR